MISISYLYNELILVWENLYLVVGKGYILLHFDTVQEENFHWNLNLANGKVNFLTLKTAY